MHLDAYIITCHMASALAVRQMHAPLLVANSKHQTQVFIEQPLKRRSLLHRCYNMAESSQAHQEGWEAVSKQLVDEEQQAADKAAC